MSRLWDLVLQSASMAVQQGSPPYVFRSYRVWLICIDHLTVQQWQRVHLIGFSGFHVLCICPEKYCCTIHLTIHQPPLQAFTKNHVPQILLVTLNACCLNPEQLLYRSGLRRPCQAITVRVIQECPCLASRTFGLQRVCRRVSRWGPSWGMDPASAPADKQYNAGMLLPQLMLIQLMLMMQY